METETTPNYKKETPDMKEQEFDEKIYSKSTLGETEQEIRRALSNLF